MAPNASINKATNLWVSRVIPLILVGIVGYVSWVEIKLLCGQAFQLIPLIHADRHPQWTTSLGLPPLSTLLALAQRLPSSWYTPSFSTFSFSPTPGSFIPLSSIPDTFHAAASGALYMRTNRRDSTIKTIRKDAAEVLMGALGRMPAGKAQGMEPPPATVMRVRYPQCLRLQGQRLACKTFTPGMHSSVRQMGALIGALPA